MTIINIHTETDKAYFGTGPKAFDPAYYLKANLDVAKSLEGRTLVQQQRGALHHFLDHGATEGRNPSALFNTRAYLAKYPDVAAAKINPLRHYRTYGAAEGRDPTGGAPPRSWAAGPDVQPVTETVFQLHGQIPNGAMSLMAAIHHGSGVPAFMLGTLDGQGVVGQGVVGQSVLGQAASGLQPAATALAAIVEDPWQKRSTQGAALPDHQVPTPEFHAAMVPAQPGFAAVLDGIEGRGGTMLPGLSSDAARLFPGA